MKKTLALVLALAMVFSTITVAFAEGELGADAQTCVDLGMLKGETGTVDAAYVATAPTRLQAAVMFLRLKGLEAEALAFTGEDNFADGNIAWAEGANLLAYLKANPQLGWIGDGVSFNPGAAMTAQAYYKVMLEALGYKQTTAEVAGDFAWEEVLTFAASVGLSKVAAVENFTVNDLAVATVEALKLNVKGTEAALYKSLVTEEAAVAAGLVEAAVAVAVDSAEALGNSVVEVAFEDDVDAAAAGNVANYAIAGLDINAAVVTGADTVRLETAAMTAGKLYTLTVGEKSVKFTGIAKVSGTPDFTAASNDVEEVVLTFDKVMDFATATDIANYAIDGIEIVKAEVSGKEVTLTTVGLVARKQYTVKATNVKCVDGYLMKSESDSFYARVDTTIPKIKSVDEETNQRLVLTFTKEVTKESAENLENYSIKTVVGEEPLEILSVVWDDDAEDNVTITTEVQAVGKKYELSVVNIVDQTKAANTLTKADTEYFYGLREDSTDPTFDDAYAISRSLVKVVFKDNASELDESTILDVNNYTLKKGSTEYAVENVEKVSSDLKEYVALVTVEDMGVGSYSLEADNIMDEFGNEMDADKEYFTVDTDTFASASFAAAITGEYEITITFDKELDEDSAEDIANYSIDGDIGAPISATYDDTNAPTSCTVVLETVALLDNVEYDITVNGVVDLAGNVLNYEYEDAINTGWDTEDPALEDVYAVNQNVIAMTFDEAVDYTGTVNLTLHPSDDSGDVNFVACAFDSDDTVIEFSSATGLTDDKTYTVTDITYTATDYVSDVALNCFDLPSNIAEYLVYGTAEAPEEVEVVNVSQINGVSFELTMSDNLTAKTGTVNATILNDTTVAFDYEAEDDVVTFTISSGQIQENEEYVFDLSALLDDEYGFDVADDNSTTGKTTFYAEYEDEENPYIISVVAVDRDTVEVEYSEDMDETIDFRGIFSIKNADEDVSTAEMINQTSAINASGTTVTIELATPLQSIYDYNLIIGAGNAVDVSGNIDEETLNDEFSFSGTDLAQ